MLKRHKIWNGDSTLEGDRGFMWVPAETGDLQRWRDRGLVPEHWWRFTIGTLISNWLEQNEGRIGQN